MHWNLPITQVSCNLEEQFPLQKNINHLNIFSYHFKSPAILRVMPKMVLHLLAFLKEFPANLKWLYSKKGIEDIDTVTHILTSDPVWFPAFVWEQISLCSFNWTVLILFFSYFRCSHQFLPRKWLLKFLRQSLLLLIHTKEIIPALSLNQRRTYEQEEVCELNRIFMNFNRGD